MPESTVGQASRLPHQVLKPLLSERPAQGGVLGTGAARSFFEPTSGAEREQAPTDRKRGIAMSGRFPCVRTCEPATSYADVGVARTSDHQQAEQPTSEGSGHDR